MKTCKKCNTIKEDKNFSKSKLGNSWDTCKQCQTSKMRTNKKAKAGMSYKEILEKAGMYNKTTTYTEYYKQSLRFQV